MHSTKTTCLSQGYKYLGLNHADGATIYREWAPAAQAVALIGDFSGWQEASTHAMEMIVILSPGSALHFAGLSVRPESLCCTKAS